MSIPCPVIVNVWAFVPTFLMVRVAPFFTERLLGAKTSWPFGPCSIVLDPAAAPPVELDGLLLHAAPASVTIKATPISALPRPRERIRSIGRNLLRSRREAPVGGSRVVRTRAREGLRAH